MVGVHGEGKSNAWSLQWSAVQGHKSYWRSDHIKEESTVDQNSRSETVTRASGNIWIKKV